MISALLSYPRLLSARALICSLPYALDGMFRRELYESYAAFCLQLICENTAKLSGGKAPGASFSELLSGKAYDDRSGEEIAADVISRLGLEVTG